MKRNTVIGMMLLTAVATANGTESLRQVKQLLIQVESIRSERDRVIYSFLDADDWRKSGEFAQLKETVAQHTEEILGNIEGIVGASEIHQYILFESFCFLPRQDSLRCLNTFADLALNNIISKQMFRWAIVSYAINNRHVLALNYKDPLVAEILRKAKIINPELEWYRKMASGAAKRALEHPLYYDTETGEEPNITSVRSWVVFLGRMLIRVAIVAVAVIGAILAWRSFRRKKKQE